MVCRVPSLPGANPLVAERGSWIRSFDKGLADRGGWREEILHMPEIQASFLYPFSHPSLGEGGHISGWSSSQSRVTGGQQPIGNPYIFLLFLLHTWQPLCDPNRHLWGRLFQLPGG